MGSQSSSRGRRGQHSREYPRAPFRGRHYADPQHRANKEPIIAVMGCVSMVTAMNGERQHRSPERYRVLSIGQRSADIPPP
jgi:hypothetical protein